MAQRRYPLLAREGWAHIVIALALALSVHFLWGVWAALPVWLFLVFVLALVVFVTYNDILRLL